MKKCGAILAALFLLMAMTICAAGDENTLERLDYSKEENWAYCETGKAETSIRSQGTACTQFVGHTIRKG